MEIVVSERDVQIIIAALKNSVALALANDEIDDCCDYSDLCSRLMKQIGAESDID